MRKTDEIRKMIEANGGSPIAITVSEGVYDQLDNEWDGVIEDNIVIYGVPIWWSKDVSDVEVEYL